MKRATFLVLCAILLYRVSIHALNEESDPLDLKDIRELLVSIHALNEESD